MLSIEFDFPWDNSRRICKIVDVSKGSGGYQVLIDNYYNGEIRKIGGEWVGYLNQRSDLTSDDVQFIGGLIDTAIVARYLPEQ